MKKILVPVDFSEHSEYALEVASQIAREKHMVICVLHMIGLSESVLSKNEAEEYKEAQYYMKLAKKRFKPFLDKEYLKGLKLLQLVQNYKIFSEINAIVKELNIDLVVMGSHGVSRARDTFVGSNTEKVVRTCEVPVLVIKQPRHEFQLKTLVFAWDFKDEIVQTFSKVKEFAQFFDAQVYPVFVNTPTVNFLSSTSLEEKLNHYRVQENIQEEVRIFNDISVEKGILNYAKEIGADAVAIPTHGRKGIAHFLKGSIGESIANQAKIPVVTFKIDT
ncbi:universal stress protein [Flagellimonas sp. S3867]|uniref:universal stress protein n=1 Tax=Flagellimonas sp. S3867 TaxID=2768063 RepID=UPI001681C460|nr:universal stress protein [Flagellimonas sp. S3867]